MTLIFDFNRNQVDGIILSKTVTEDAGRFKDFGVRIAVQKGVVRSILFCTYYGYLNLKTYVGKFRFNEIEFKLSHIDTPDSVKAIFGEPDEEWDDDSEHNCIYKKEKSNIEFSWFHTKRGMLMAYVSVDDY